MNIKIGEIDIMKKFSFNNFISCMFDKLLSIKYSFAQKMIAKYSDDQNYVILTGEVTEFDKK